MHKCWIVLASTELPGVLKPEHASDNLLPDAPKPELGAQGRKSSTPKALLSFPADIEQDRSHLGTHGLHRDRTWDRLRHGLGGCGLWAVWLLGFGPLVLDSSCAGLNSVLWVLGCMKAFRIYGFGNWSRRLRASGLSLDGQGKEGP